MTGKADTYPAVYIIFTLLNALRRGVERKHIWREFRRQRIALKPRVSFWAAVCREAGLIKTGDRLQVTGYARAWLKKLPEEQTFDLIEAWQNAPKNHGARQFRRKLLWKLKYDRPLTQKDQGALHGLKGLGLVNDDGKLTKWGGFFISPARTTPKDVEACGVKREGKLPAPKAVEPCVIQDGHLVAPLPQHSELLWDIEQYLRPKAPGVYPLTKRALQFYDGDPYGLIELIERGLGKAMPGQIKALLLKQPSLRIADGIVLEFSSPDALKQLRRQPIFRKYIAEFLSPQRVLVSKEKAAGLFELLKRRGVYMQRNEEQVPVRTKRTHFPSASKRLMTPVGKSISKITVIEKYRQLAQALDILYRAPGCPAEQRRITPLLIEERGGQTYIIAYCQTRRAQRTFRLDRMEIPGTW